MLEKLDSLIGMPFVMKKNKETNIYLDQVNINVHSLLSPASIFNSYQHVHFTIISLPAIVSAKVHFPYRITLPQNPQTDR